jgi:hypothetical protein
VTAVLFQFVWEVDDADGFERAFFDADSAAATEYLRYNGFVSFNSYGFHSAAHHWAEVNAGLVALFDFAPVLIENSDPRHSTTSSNELDM